MLIKKIFINKLKDRKLDLKVYDCVFQYDYKYERTFLHSSYQRSSTSTIFYILNKKFAPYILSFLIEILFLSIDLKINKIILNNKLMIDLNEFKKTNYIENLDVDLLIDEFEFYLKEEFNDNPAVFSIELICEDDDYAFDLLALSIYFK